MRSIKAALDPQDIFNPGKDPPALSRLTPALSVPLAAMPGS
jgi:hypothetical protein